ncbi:MAG: 2Fe-2S iron-sulfur cluster-binding protein [Candidatus Binatia bacterium]
MRRIDSGGRIDRLRPLRFTFDGAELRGFAGDTLASALLAAGVRVVAHSVLHGRPRGVFSAGSEEPNAIVQLGEVPLAPATQVELHDGLAACSLAGRGRLVQAGGTDRYEKRHAHCDVLVIGGGAAGLAAALAAGRTGARVLLADEQPELGGWLLGAREEIDRAPALAWVASTVAELGALPETRILTRTAAVGSYDANCVFLAERVSEHLGLARPSGLVRQRLWQVRARQVVIATGAIERPIVFANNDRPGVMLAGAARAYANRFAVAAGRRVAVFTTGDPAYATALDLAAAGVEVVAVVDARSQAVGELPQRARAADIQVLTGHAVVDTDGEDGLVAIRVAPLLDGGDAVGGARRIEVDLLAVSGGLDPALALHHHRRGPVRFDAELGCWMASAALPGQQLAGAANGRFALEACLRDGFAAGARAARDAGFGDGVAPQVPAVDAPAHEPAMALPLVPGIDGGDLTRHYVDLHRDAVAAEVLRALGAGVRSIEHVKRFTLIGTGFDQGRTAGPNAAAIAAAVLGRGVDEVGTSTTRAPSLPLSFSLLAGRATGERYDPVRTTPMQAWHEAYGAVFEPVGQWQRAWYYPRAGESMDDAVLRECAAARQSVAVMDASTLGKIDVQGPDAVEFLNRMYTNSYDTLAVGMCRYGLLCSLDGMVMDDGVVMRLARDRFIATTTTGGAARVVDHMEEFLQTEWPELRVRLTSVTEQWATVAVVGPRSREVIRAVAPGLDVSREGFPFMAIRDCNVAGIRARICRISFSGELAYEINVPGFSGLAVWETVMAAGRPFGITPYGTETMHVLRAEKGFIIVGQETDGTVTPQDLGMEWIIAKKKPFYVGKRSHARPDNLRPDRRKLVGLLPLNPMERLPEGAQLVLDPDQPVPMKMIGWVSSSYCSAALGRTFALALVERGPERIGQIVHAPLPDRTIAAEIVQPVFYDPQGARRDG